VYRRIHGKNMTYEVYEPSKARADLRITSLIISNTDVTRAPT